MTDNVLPFKSRKYVNFYREYIDCDFCGQQTLGRVYEGSQSIDCGACGRAMFEVRVETGALSAADVKNGSSE